MDFSQTSTKLKITVYYILSIYLRMLKSERMKRNYHQKNNTTAEKKRPPFPPCVYLIEIVRVTI